MTVMQSATLKMTWSQCSLPQIHSQISDWNEQNDALMMISVFRINFANLTNHFLFIFNSVERTFAVCFSFCFFFSCLFLNTRYLFLSPSFWLFHLILWHSNYDFKLSCVWMFHEILLISWIIFFFQHSLDMSCDIHDCWANHMLQTFR